MDHHLQTYPVAGTSIFKADRLFLGGMVLLFTLGLYPLLYLDQVALFVALNACHHPLLDLFFYSINVLASLSAVVLLGILLLVTGRRPGRMTLLATSLGMTSLVVQLLKHLLPVARPIASVPEGTPLHLVAGIVPMTDRSFPSGHAATIFVMVAVIHLEARHKPWWFTVLSLMVACSVAYARIYLCQHFYRDVYVGALLGVVLTTVMRIFVVRWGAQWHRRLGATA